MKRFYLVVVSGLSVGCLVGLASIFMFAQGGVGFGFITPATALTNCPIPTAGMNDVCSGPDGWYVANGATPLVKVGSGTIGPMGPAGPAGATGAKGATGTTGANGATGATGPQGQIGLTGLQGIQGIPGVSGVSWSTCTGVVMTPSGVGVYTLTIDPANCK